MSKTRFKFDGDANDNAHWHGEYMEHIDAMAETQTIDRKAAESSGADYYAQQLSPSDAAEAFWLHG